MTRIISGIFLLVAVFGSYLAFSGNNPEPKVFESEPEPEEVDEHTLFRLGSVSKGFASVLTGVTVEEGVVGWDVPVSRYVSEFKLYDPGLL